MQTHKLKATIGDDGLLKIALPTDLKNVDAEIVLVLQPLRNGETDAMGYPVDYFEQIDSVDADDILERADQGTFEEREPLE